MVGATLGAAVVALVAFFDEPKKALIVIIYFIVYQQLENYAVMPRIMQQTVAVPGAVTVVAALAGGTLLGILGALLAIPFAAGALLHLRGGPRPPTAATLTCRWLRRCRMPLGLLPLAAHSGVLSGRRCLTAGRRGAASSRCASAVGRRARRLPRPATRRRAAIPGGMSCWHPGHR